jgi:hypothetical protein
MGTWKDPQRYMATNNNNQREHTEQTNTVWNKRRKRRNKESHIREREAG